MRGQTTDHQRLETMDDERSSPTRVALQELDHSCSELLEKVLRWLLDSKEFQLAIAELSDDMPIRDHYFGGRTGYYVPHPDIEGRLKPSDAAAELVSKFCKTFDPQTLPVDAHVSFRLNINDV